MKNGILKDVVYLFLGYLLTAVSVVMMINANVGLSPWDVFHQGISIITKITMGQASIVVGICVIVASVALGENLGWGTIGNIFVPGVLIDVISNLNVIPKTENLYLGILMLVAALVVMAIATILYLIPAYGCGPRDGLMIALYKKTNKSIGLLRGIMEVLAVIVGYFMGGQFGVGTLIAAFGFGYILEFGFKIVKYEPKDVEHKMIFSNLKRKRA